jgi:hypothetical protein
MKTDNFCFYLQNRLIQTSQTGVNSTVILPPSVFPGTGITYNCHLCQNIFILHATEVSRYQTAHASEIFLRHKFECLFRILFWQVFRPTMDDEIGSVVRRLRKWSTLCHASPLPPPPPLSVYPILISPFRSSKKDIKAGRWKGKSVKIRTGLELTKLCTIILRPFLRKTCRNLQKKFSKIVFACIEINASQHTFFGKLFCKLRHVFLKTSRKIFVLCFANAKHGSCWKMIILQLRPAWPCGITVFIKGQSCKTFFLSSLFHNH